MTDRHDTKKQAVVGGGALLAYAATIPLANWLITHYGMVPVSPGLLAPAGVYAAGLALALRDWVHERLGAWGALVGIALGAVLSLLVGKPELALASAAAFALSELADLAVYTPLRERGKALAVLASGAVGLVVDSVLFLAIAFGSLDFLAGQVVGKAWMTLLAAGVVLAKRWARERRAVTA